MLQEDKQILWRTSAVLLGAALPAMMLGKAIMFVLLGLGILCGLSATKGESLRATVWLMLNNWVTLLLVAMMGVMLIGVWTGINPSFAFGKWQQMVLVLLVTAGLFITLREMPGRHLEVLLKALAIGTVSAAALGLIDALAGYPRLSAALHGEDKALTPYRLNFLSSMLAVLLPFLWARLALKAREGEPFAQRVALPVAVFVTVVALASGGRAGWGGLAAGTLAFLFLAGRYHGLVLHAKHYAGMLATVAFSFVLYGFSFGWDFMFNRVTIVGEQGVGRGMLSGRFDVWDKALMHMWDMPLFGIGIMNFRNLPEPLDLHPHNWFLQLMLETGIAGTAIFVALAGILLYRFFNFARGNLYGVAAFASLCAFLVAGLANTSIFNLWWLGYFVFVCVLGWRAGWGGADLKQRRRGKLPAGK